MKKRPIVYIIISILFLLISACSNKEEPEEREEHLVIKSDSEREEVKTEADVFQDMMHRLKNVYFPTKVGHLEQLYITYEVENEEISLFYDYNAFEESKPEDLSIPSRFRLSMNDERLDKEKHIEEVEEHYFTHDSLEGYYGGNIGELDFVGKDNEYGDAFLYRFDWVNYKQPYQELLDSGMQKVANTDYEEGHAFFSHLLQLDLHELSFLDVRNTNFDIEEVYMSVTDFKDKDFPTLIELNVKYNYKDYTFTLNIFEPNANHGPIQWTENGYDYKIDLSPMEDIEMKEEYYDEFRKFMTRKVTDD